MQHSHTLSVTVTIDGTRPDDPDYEIFEAVDPAILYHDHEGDEKHTHGVSNIEEVAHMESALYLM